MRVDPERTVIAVFGSDTETEAERSAVERLAVAIHTRKAVLLSGADPPSDGYPDRPTPVKDVAVYALRDVAPGASAHWIGVARHDAARGLKPRGAAGVVVTPGWDHRRNLVEACLCDAAIAVRGTTPGTASEALFCLYLGRPVFLLAGPATLRTPRDLRGRIGNRVSARGEHWAVDRAIADAFDWAESAPGSLTKKSLPADQKAADQLVKDLLAASTKQDPRPDVGTLSTEQTWDAYVTRAIKAAGRGPDNA